ncbi:MAG: L-histidine N(alpha)-methyltransferase [Phycisphaerae bacterium]
MSLHDSPNISDNLISIDDALTARGADVLVADIVAGLRQTPRRISSMFFYDDRGSQLFEQITALPEYYPTRTEKKLLRRFSRTDGAAFSDVDIVELGSGDCSKISLILDGVDREHLSSIRYVPVDVSRFAIEQSADSLAEKYPGLSIHGLVADFLTQLDSIAPGRKRLFCLLGSTIGNLSIDQRENFLRHLADIMQPGDEFLLGIDLVKPVDVLEKAYNDSQGVTAEFNRNILRVINKLAGTTFRPDRFDHVAFYRREESRIEMHLRANRDMEVVLPQQPPETLHIRRGEMIHTENSHKFTIDGATDLLQSAGLQVRSHLKDGNHWFALLRAMAPPRGHYVGC